MDEGKKILVFGAGRIGRSFIGQLFSQAGYGVVFVDVDRILIARLNERKAFPVMIRDSQHPDEESTIQVKNITALHSDEEEKIIGQIEEADVMATSVGTNGLSGLTGIPLYPAIRQARRRNAKWPCDSGLSEREFFDFDTNPVPFGIPMPFPDLPHGIPAAPVLRLVHHERCVAIVDVRLLFRWSRAFDTLVLNTGRENLALISGYPGVRTLKIVRYRLRHPLMQAFLGRIL